MGDIENPFFGLMIKGVEEVVRNSGYSLILANSNYDDALEHDLCMLMLSKQVDAILIAPSGFSSCKQYAPILDRQTHVVFIDNYVPGCNVDSVIVNNYEASKEACDYLIFFGASKNSLHRRPGKSHIFRPKDQGLCGRHGGRIRIAGTFLAQTGGSYNRGRLQMHVRIASAA